MLHKTKKKSCIFSCHYLVIAISVGLLATVFPTGPSAAGSSSNSVSSAFEYDKAKNCAEDGTKRPTSQEYLTHFNCGRITDELDGVNAIREFTLIINENQTIPISHEGHTADAWTFNNTVPGPTIRVTEGDHVRITVINSENNTLPHTMHMHSIHASEMDGVQSNPIAPGANFTYDFIAQPFGVYPYHCHIDPIADHINRGLYGVLIIDPIDPRPEMTEMVMMMNGYDIDYDMEGMTEIRPANVTEPEEEEEERDNEIYTVNGIAFDYMHTPINVTANEKIRIYLVNMLEFDLINSFHLHGAMFDYYPAGTNDKEDESFNTDIVELSQGNRGILETEFEYPGKYMFHAHVAEFTDLGWMGFFDVKEQES